MSRFYSVLYRLGVTPWEQMGAQAAIAEQISAMFDREQDAREPPLGRALDLGCGSGIHTVELARRGWDVTGIDCIPKALARARRRANDAGVEVRFVEGDATALEAAGVGSDFHLVLDFGTVHGLTPQQCQAVGRQVSAVTTPDARVLMLAFTPGRRAPLPRGMSRAEIESIYPDWTITDDVPQSGKLPWLLKKLHADPHWYRLRRK